MHLLILFYEVDIPVFKRHHRGLIFVAPECLAQMFSRVCSSMLCSNRGRHWTRLGALWSYLGSRQALIQNQSSALSWFWLWFFHRNSLSKKRSYTLMFLFGLLEFLFTLLGCFNVQATCNKGKIWYKNVKCQHPTVSHLTRFQGTSFTEVVFPSLSYKGIHYCLRPHFPTET